MSHRAMRRGTREILESNAAWLDCGHVLTYEAQSFVPQVGEVVPCHRHGYCQVVDTQRVRDKAWSRRPRKSAPRSQDELLDFLRRNPDTSVGRLKKHRFSLRMVTCAQKDGLVDVDLITGRITRRTAAAG